MTSHQNTSREVTGEGWQVKHPENTSITMRNKALIFPTRRGESLQSPESFNSTWFSPETLAPQCWRLVVFKNVMGHRTIVNAYVLMACNVLILFAERVLPRVVCSLSFLYWLSRMQCQLERGHRRVFEEMSFACQCNNVAADTVCIIPLACKQPFTFC